MSGKIFACVMITGMIAVTLLSAGCVSNGTAGDVNTTIKDTLVGTNLTYYSFAGKPMNYTIGQNDILSVEPTTYEGKDAWRVRVGESLSWDLTMDANGTKILHVDQLFQT